MGELCIQLRSAKPTTLEAAINLALELQLIQDVEQSQTATDAKRGGVSSSSPDDHFITDSRKPTPRGENTKNYS